MVVTPRKHAKAFDPHVLALFDAYVHGTISRESFISQASRHIGAGTSGDAILAELEPDYSLAQTVRPDDPDIQTLTIEYESPRGHGTVRALMAAPADQSGPLPAVLVVHENRGLNPYIEDVVRRLAKAGYLALGPAVTFGPAHAILNREIPLTIPVTTARLPSGAGLGHVEVVWRGPHMEEARLVGIASPRFQGSAGGGTLTFEMARLGTYQAVVREDAPTRRDREFVFRGILGFSMGGSGSGRIGLGNPELFDFVAPLGGPTDWTFMLEHIRNYHVGGFCTETERQLDPEGCAMGASLARTPPVEHIHEHPQHFEHWWYEDGFEGQGGTFNRTDYISIFRDLATMFGNPNYDRTADPSEPSVTPPGVPDEVRTMPASARCAPDAQIIVPPFDGDGDFLSGSEGAGFFDDEFNPDGQHPVITFCDGGEVPGDIGHWNPDGGHGMPGPARPGIRWICAVVTYSTSRTAS